MNLPNPVQSGIFALVPEREYRAAVGISQSSLKPLIGQSYAHYLEALANPHPPTRAMIESSICHQLLLTPNEPEWWIVKPEGLDGRTKEGKEWKKAAGDKPVVDTPDIYRIHSAVKAAKEDPLIALAMRDAQLELSMWSDDGAGHLLRKGRADIVPAGPVIADCKFVEDAREDAIRRMCANLFWHVQGAYYLDLYNANLKEGQQFKTQFLLFCIEKYPPFPVQYYRMDEETIQDGRREYYDALATLREFDGKPVDPQVGLYHSGSAYTRDIRTLKLRRRKEVFAI